MNMNWLESLIYGIVSGLTEFLPVSSQAHRILVLKLFGAGAESPLLRLVVDCALLAALLNGCKGTLRHLRKERQLMKAPKRSRLRRPDARSIMEWKLLKVAAIPMLIGIVLCSRLGSAVTGLNFTALFLIVNGILLYFPAYISKANKDASSLSPLDSLLIGLSGILSVFPGISRIGAGSAVSVSRGADWAYTGHFCLLLSIPALAVLILLDIIALAGAGIGTVSFMIVLNYLLSAAGTYFGAFYSIQLLRFLTAKGGFTDLSYYCWGMALFSFILYLVT